MIVHNFVIYMLIFIALDLLIKKRTDVIDNLAFIIPHILTMSLLNVLGYHNLIGLFGGLIVAMLFYTFIFLPRYTHISRRKKL
jgi:uncharacterized membrane protein YgaE (UPF0421/DUF939 family)